MFTVATRATSAALAIVLIGCGDYRPDTVHFVSESPNGDYVAILASAYGPHLGGRHRYIFVEETDVLVDVDKLNRKDAIVSAAYLDCVELSWIGDDQLQLVHQGAEMTASSARLFFPDDVDEAIRTGYVRGTVFLDLLNDLEMDQSRCFDWSEADWAEADS